MQDLPAPLSRAARELAERLRGQGHRAWIVGGAVRDLARGGTPVEIDMASDATPEQVEASFEQTVAVGRSFGTEVVRAHGVDVQLTTFRSETGYQDARRPDQVAFGGSLEEDASRRDFTCNALYLDPLTDEVRDPIGGLRDLAAGILRTVGSARERFREDGLRLFRMARFEAGLGLEPAPGLHEAARLEAEALRGVSPERVHEELSRIFASTGAGEAVGILDDCGLLERALEGWRDVAGGARPWAEVQTARRGVVRELARARPGGPGAELGFAALLEVDPLGGESAASVRAGRELLRALRPSRALLDGVVRRWNGRRAIERAATPEAPRSARIRAVRGEAWHEDWLLARAWTRASGGDAGGLEELAVWRAALEADELDPERWIGPAELTEAAVPRGPLWGELLEEVERRQLDGELASREEARQWLARRARELAGQDGGNARRNP